jgi:hypothetical protein
LGPTLLLTQGARTMAGEEKRASGQTAFGRPELS